MTGNYGTQKQYEVTTMKNNPDKITQSLNLKKYSEHEKMQLQHFAEHKLANQSPKLAISDDDKNFQPENDDALLFAAQCKGALGVSDHDLGNLLLSQILATLPENREARLKQANATLAFLFDVRPKNAIEGTLAVQMMTTHHLAMNFMARATNSEMPSELITANVSRATKLLKVFSKQIEMLQRLRSDCQQKVIVEHVHVYEGGQAIVGNIGEKKSDGGIVSRGGGNAKS